MKTVRVLMIALLVSLGACGGGSGGSKPAATSEADATLKIRDQAASVQAKAASGFAGATDGQALALGDSVKTNGTGFAQVNYKDGSLTRLDANAQFTLADLSTAAQAQRVVGTLDGGRAWSNVQKITSSDGRYEIDTSVGTASVRGTRFNVDCTASDGSCTFSVVDGTVTVTPNGGTPIELHAGDSLTVHSDHTVTRNPTLTPEQLAADPWIGKNLTIDTNEPLRVPGSSSSSSSEGTGASAPANCANFSGPTLDLYITNNTVDGHPEVGPPCTKMKAGQAQICAKWAEGGSAIKVEYSLDGVTGTAGFADECVTVDLTPGTHTLTSPRVPGQTATVIAT